MKATIKKKDVLIVAASAAIAESILFSILSHQQANHNPGLLFLFHLPGMVLVDLAGIPDPKAQVMIAFTGAVQLFVLFLVALFVWRSIYGRHGT